MAAAASSTSSACRAQTTTEAPACASPAAIALPRPLPDPVTIATRSRRSNRSRLKTGGERGPAREPHILTQPQLKAPSDRLRETFVRLEVSAYGVIAAAYSREFGNFVEKAEVGAKER